MFTTRGLFIFTAKPFDFSNPAKYISCAKIIDLPVNFIGGKWVATSQGASTITVEDPCTEEPCGDVPCLGKQQCEETIKEAVTGFHHWKKVIPRDRAIVLRRWSDLMIEHRVTLGTILSRESGKVLSEGVGEVDYAQRFVEWFAGEAERVYGDIIPSPRPNVLTTVIKQPVGVVGIITPWNFPAAMITRASAAAIAAGCSVVIKPASATPFTALALAQLAEEAGIPPGVLNVITGNSSEISAALLDSFDVRKISFTGSTVVGKQLFRGSAETMKKVTMELGGNAPFIVFEDADLTRAADALMLAKFRNGGQTCICCNRVLVQESVFEKFKQLVLQRLQKVKVGNAFDRDSTMGSLIDEKAVKSMEAFVRDAKEKGAVVEIGGQIIDGKGHFFPPTLLTNVQHNVMSCCQEEIFGPILPLVSFKTEEEAVTLANSTRAGLASYFFSKDYSRQFRVAKELSFGMVGVNEGALSSPCAPFGGVKESGLGRDGSKYGIEPYVDIKYVLLSTV